MTYIFESIDKAERFEWSTALDTAADVLTALADDPLHQVRQYVACHVNTPTEIIDRLVDDPDPITADLALMNPNISDAKMEQVAGGPRSHILAKNPALTEQTIDLLLEYTGEYAVAVFRHLANHPNTPLHIVRMLAETADPRISSVSKRRLASS